MKFHLDDYGVYQALAGSLCSLDAGLNLALQRLERDEQMDLNFGSGPELGNGLIPSVNPADLRSVCAVQRDVRSRFPGQQILMADDAWEHACSAGADLFAIWYRIAILEMVTEQGLLSHWLHNGELEEAVFKVFATFPLKRIQKGGQEGFPFDIQELTKQIEKEASAGEI